MLIYQFQRQEIDIPLKLPVLSQRYLDVTLHSTSHHPATIRSYCLNFLTRIVPRLIEEVSSRSLLIRQSVNHSIDLKTYSDDHSTLILPRSSLPPHDRLFRSSAVMQPIMAHDLHNYNSN